MSDVFFVREGGLSSSLCISALAKLARVSKSSDREKASTTMYATMKTKVKMLR